MFNARFNMHILRQLFLSIHLSVLFLHEIIEINDVLVTLEIGQASLLRLPLFFRFFSKMVGAFCFLFDGKGLSPTVSIDAIENQKEDDATQRY
jgi:hypothetical protein